MKKIALVMFEMPDYGGGVIPYTEDLYHGLVGAGYKVGVFYLNWHSDAHRSTTRSSGVLVKLACGLRARAYGERASVYGSPKITRLYKGEAKARAVAEELSEYEGVIVCSIPFTGRTGNSDWVAALGSGKPTICIAHDSEYLRYYPWIIKFPFNAFVGVHPGTFEKLKVFPARIACVVNPIDISPNTTLNPVSKRWDWVCMTTFYRSWKHNDDGVRAAPYLKPIRLISAGGGIDLSYLKATLKSREEYTGKSYEAYRARIRHFTWREDDPDVKPEWIGKGIWEIAHRYGNFKYVGLLARAEDVGLIQSACGGVVEFAYHKRGEHWGRAMIEAMIHRCIPFARPRGISDNDEGKGVVFGPENVVLIPESASPKRIAEIIKTAMGDETLRRNLVAKNLQKLKKFERKAVAHQLVQLLDGRGDVGLFGIWEGRPDSKTLGVMKHWGATVRFPRLQRFPRLKS